MLGSGIPLCWSVVDVLTRLSSRLLSPLYHLGDRTQGEVPFLSGRSSFLTPHSGADSGSRRWALWVNVNAERPRCHGQV